MATKEITKYPPLIRQTDGAYNSMIQTSIETKSTCQSNIPGVSYKGMKNY